MKKIDRLIIAAFIPPLVVWFMIAVFIFNMQFLWKYIDDIVGKGLELRVILELLFYQALAMVPRALVFGVMIASVMTLGNLAEHYELAAMKSSGVSLIRVMRPLMGMVGILAIASFIFSNNIIPVTALQFKTRLYDIRKQKPALDLEAGQFNNDFKNIVIYIGDKDRSSRKIKNVRIYDHSKNIGNVSQTNAADGELYFSEDKRYLVLNLENGQRYEDMQSSISKNGSNVYPYMRMRFKTFETLFDLSEFNFSETDKDVFKNHYSLLTLPQLFDGIDSIIARRTKRIEEIKLNSDNFFYFQRSGAAPTDSIKTRPERQYSPFITSIEPQKGEGKSYIEFIPKGERHLNYQRAQGSARNVKTQADNVMRGLPHLKEETAAFENEIHLKFVWGIACILFLFIGAPMGAIIRKGGFGWPIFISFVFFMAFFVLHLTGERLAKGLIWPCWMGSWLPIWSLFPLAVFLSIRAMNDSKMMGFGLFKMLWAKLFKRKK